MIARMIGKRTAVPNLVVAQRVIDKMTAAAKSYLEDETGEAMVGLAVHNSQTGISTLYVIDTIAPDGSAVRHYHTFQQGDERQDEIFYWWRENWRVFRARLPLDSPAEAKWNVPLHHLGDWHKQPGFMIQPSGGDLMTALEWLADPSNTLGFMLAPIVTLGHPSGDDQGGITTQFITIPDGDGSNIRIDWWYIDKHSRAFLPITPTVYPDANLPALPGMPWHLADETRFDLECRRLRDHGLFLSLTLWDADDALPVEVCFLLLRADWDHIILLATPHDYPAHPPRARVAPFIPMNKDSDLYHVFEQAWAKSEPVHIEADSWDSDRWLIDYIKAIAIAHHLPLDPVAMRATSTGEVAKVDADAGAAARAEDHPNSASSAEAGAEEEKPGS